MKYILYGSSDAGSGCQERSLLTFEPQYGPLGGTKVTTFQSAFRPSQARQYRSDNPQCAPKTKDYFRQTVEMGHTVVQHKLV
jgi:hypothetical protein